MPDSPDDHALAVRTVRLIAVAVLAFVVAAAVLAGTVLFGDDDDSDPSTVDDPVLDDDGADEGDLGPVDGVELEQYALEAAGRLRDAEGRRTAAVSFEQYRTTGGVQRLVNAPDVEIVALLVALRGDEAAVVESGGLDAFVARRAETARSERDEITKLLPTVTDPEFAAFYRDEVTRFGRIVASAKPGAAVVFGLVVRADASALRDLADTDGVRLVDVGATAPTELADVRGVRPEERARAGEPEFRP